MRPSSLSLGRFCPVHHCFSSKNWDHPRGFLNTKLRYPQNEKTRATFSINFQYFMKDTPIQTFLDGQTAYMYFTITLFASIIHKLCSPQMHWGYPGLIKTLLFSTLSLRGLPGPPNAFVGPGRCCPRCLHFRTVLYKLYSRYKQENTDVMSTPVEIRVPRLTDAQNLNSREMSDRNIYCINIVKPTIRVQISNLLHYKHSKSHQ
jgi:hypothetical protein